MKEPTCMEKLGLGDSVIFAGKGELPRGLLPPHADKKENRKTVTTKHATGPKRKLPMHPLVARRSYPAGELFEELDNMELDNMEWKTRSVEAGDRLSKLSLANVATQAED